MGTIKILAIGNSFSQDATYYLHQLAKSGGIDTKVVNLYIGGCSLETHWQNIEQDARLYLYEKNGMPSDQYVSIRETLEEEDWDYVISQQASHFSGIKESYYPYINNLYEYIKEYAPNAERLLHQTWAYETDSTHGCFEWYHHSQQEMYGKLCEAYRAAAGVLGVRMIPSGNVIQTLRQKEPFIYEKGGMSLCRDGFHMHLIYGRYLLAATWYEFIFGENIMENKYVPKTDLAPDEGTDLKALDVIRECVHGVIAEKH